MLGIAASLVSSVLPEWWGVGLGMGEGAAVEKLVSLRVLVSWNNFFCPEDSTEGISVSCHAKLKQCVIGAWQSIHWKPALCLPCSCHYLLLLIPRFEHWNHILIIAVRRRIHPSPLSCQRKGIFHVFLRGVGLFKGKWLSYFSLKLDDKISLLELDFTYGLRCFPSLPICKRDIACLDSCSSLLSALLSHVQLYLQK